jgi:hypothetical protein
VRKNIRSGRLLHPRRKKDPLALPKRSRSTHQGVLKAEIVHSQDLSVEVLDIEYRRPGRLGTNECLQMRKFRECSDNGFSGGGGVVWWAANQGNSASADLVAPSFAFVQERWVPARRLSPPPTTPLIHSLLAPSRLTLSMLARSALRSARSAGAATRNATTRTASVRSRTPSPAHQLPRAPAGRRQPHGVARGRWNVN